MRKSSVKDRRPTIAILTFTLGTGLAAALWAAQPSKPGKGHEFKFVESHDKNTPSSLFKNLVTGSKVEYRTAGLALVTEMRIVNCKEDGSTNLIVKAPECSFQIGPRVVSSPGPLQIETGDGQFLIEGNGFHCQLTNFNLIVSNNVQTTVRRELIQSAGLGVNTLRSVTASSKTSNAGFGTNQVIRIFSDHLVLDNELNVAIYTGHVRVDDAQISLDCESLTLRPSTNDTVESIVAERSVVIFGKQNSSRAYGDKAVYRFNELAEIVELTGEPARWQDRDRRGQAELLIFDPRSNTLRTERAASITLPRAAVTQPDFFLPKAGSGKKATTASLAATNQFIEIAADIITIQLPATNRPARSILAQTNVLITSPADNSRATAERATYTDATGILELTGKVVWLADQRVVGGDTLAFDRTNQMFSARGHAYLKLPLATLTGPSLSGLKSRAPQKGPAGPAQFIEIFSDDFDYQSDLLTFRENVRGNYLAGETVLGKLACGWLTVKLTSNQVNTIVAQRHVAAEELPVRSADGRAVGKSLNCEFLTIHVTTNGFLSSMVAETNVVALQNEIRPDKPVPLQTILTAAIVTAFFFATNNQVEQVVAEQHVSVVQEGRSAQGAIALYTATNDVMVLTGPAILQTPQGLLKAPSGVVLQHFSSWPDAANKPGLLGSNLSRPKPVRLPQPGLK